MGGRLPETFRALPGRLQHASPHPETERILLSRNHQAKRGGLESAKPLSSWPGLILSFNVVPALSRDPYAVSCRLGAMSETSVTTTPCGYGSRRSPGRCEPSKHLEIFAMFPV